MDFTAWTVDLASLSATHSCGFSLQVEGNPQDPSALFPGKFPAGLSSIEQVRLLRTGVEAIAKAAEGGGYSAGYSTRPAAPKKPAYKAPADKPARPLISLKKNRTEDQ